MISISSGLKPRASQRCRNNCLTLEMENGPRQILRFAATPPPCCVGGRGDGSRSHGLELKHSLILYDVRNDGVLKLLDPLVMAPEMELGFIRVNAPASTPQRPRGSTRVALSLRTARALLPRQRKEWAPLRSPRPSGASGETCTRRSRRGVELGWRERLPQARDGWVSR